MLQVLTPDKAQKHQFQGYNDLFEHLTEIENLKMLGEHPDFKSMQWSFAIYHADRVAELYTHMDNPSGALRQAFEQNLPLIEMCTGDFENPVYIPVTPNIDITFYQKKWAVEYCNFHNLTVNENDQGGDEGSTAALDRS